eukprot:GFUD01068183.1.p3 GENE.GFUD01068183.1~~GFUD01068183.1.p3  ORF type:complete len:104 (-),score=36.35 GFUD01068183.1:30-341(-)
MFFVSRQKTKWKRRKKQNSRRTQARTSAKDPILWSGGFDRWSKCGREAQEPGDRDVYLWRIQARSGKELDIKQEDGGRIKVSQGGRGAESKDSTDGENTQVVE